MIAFVYGAGNEGPAAVRMPRAFIPNAAHRLRPGNFLPDSEARPNHRQATRARSAILRPGRLPPARVAVRAYHRPEGVTDMPPRIKELTPPRGAEREDPKGPSTARG